jgi:hypothetical protein
MHNGEAGIRGVSEHSLVVAHSPGICCVERQAIGGVGGAMNRYKNAFGGTFRSRHLVRQGGVSLSPRGVTGIGCPNSMME